MQNNHLIICEDFYSIQGEGPSHGTPAVFLRLAGCNLNCNGFSYKHPETGEHLGCDTKHVWKKGKKIDFGTITNHWKENGWLTALKQGAHLVITGGEPLIQQETLTEFINYLKQPLATTPYIELETNATILPNPVLLNRIDQINASPKLISSGEPRQKAYHPNVLNALAENEHVIFKFVLSKESDIDEVIEQYCKPFNIEHNRIWLMPEGGTREAMYPKALWTVELCKKYSMNYSPRLHIELWDEATGK